MTLIDYHVHTDNSFDCKIPMVEMCGTALDMGISEVAFTDHFNNHLLDIDLGYYSADRFFDDVTYCRSQFPQLTIRAGIEVGEPHRWGKRIRRVVENYPYDVVLGSLHWIGNNNMFDANYFRARTPEQAYTEYFTELSQMIRTGGFDIVAHVDVFKRVSCEVYGKFDVRECEEALRNVWQACIDTQTTIEINTKGIRSSVRQFHPTTEALRWYVEMGGERLTLGSDAHHPDSLAGSFDLARQSAREAGIKRICRFEKRQIIDWVDL
jgi:histidinol-phosphatase (PHP family)